MQRRPAPTWQKRAISSAHSSRPPFASEHHAPPGERRAAGSLPADPFAVASGPGVDRRAWWHACESDPHATFFATPDWSDILTDTFPAFRARPFHFRFGDGESAVLPAIEVSRAFGRLRALHSMPFGTYGGIIGAPRIDEGRAAALVAHVATAGFGRYQTTIFPNPLAPPAGLAHVANAQGLVHVPDLTRGYDAWWRALDERTRYHISKAERRGVAVTRGLCPRTFDAFHRLYRSASRGYREPLGDAFFRSLFRYRSSRTELWTARRGDRLLAGVLVLRQGSQVTPFLSAVDERERALAPTNLIYARLIEACCDENVRELDFLGSNARDGVERFKRSMGGRPLAFRYLDLRSPLCPLVRNPISRGCLRLGAKVVTRFGGAPSARA